MGTESIIWPPGIDWPLWPMPAYKGDGLLWKPIAYDPWG